LGKVKIVLLPSNIQYVHIVANLKLLIYVSYDSSRLLSTIGWFFRSFFILLFRALVKMNNLF
jgi:hypothetical protein